MQVTVYSVADLDSLDDDAEMGDVSISCPQVALHRMPSKLSSIAWSPDQPVRLLAYLSFLVHSQDQSVRCMADVHMSGLQMTCGMLHCCSF